jgi:hypothetical protein
LQCSCFQEGKCTAKGNNSGTRTSTMTCPTTVVTGGPNVAGCTGTVTIKALDGTVLALDRPIGEGLSDLNTNSECGAEFPASFGLRRSVMGTITQSCTAGSIAADDRVLQQVVRSTNDYLSTTEWLDLNPATCNPNTGFPPGACQNDGGAWITFAAAESGVQCVADNFSCGQLADDGSSGPPPSVCRVGSSGQCECRCARCTPEGTLVNLGAGDQGKFVVASSNAAFACDVTVTGN